MGAYRLKIVMKDLPAVARTLIVPKKISLAALHAVIQYALGWRDYHLYDFSTQGDPTRYTNDSEGAAEYEYYRENPPDTPHRRVEMILARPLKLAHTVPLEQLLARGKEIDYTYDFGDNWQLSISLEEVITDYLHPHAVCSDAQEAGPPEDVGGTTAFMNFLQAWHNPAHPEHKEMVAWGRSQGFTGRVDLKKINLFLKQKLPLGDDDLSRTLYWLNRHFLPFDQPVAFNPLLDSAQASSTHFLSYFTDFLRTLQERGRVRLTAKGSLPVKLVKELFYERGYDFAQAEWRSENVRREADAWFLGQLHDLAGLTGLIKHRENTLCLTKKGEMFLQSPGAENYYTLLWDYLAAFNLGHEQGREPLPYDLYPYLFGLLAQFGDREREIGFYADKLLEIDPFLIDDEDGEVQARYWFGYRLYSRVMQRLFAEFGLVQTRSEQDKGQAFQDRCFVQRTPLFDQVLLRW